MSSPQLKTEELSQSNQSNEPKIGFNSTEAFEILAKLKTQTHNGSVSAEKTLASLRDKLSGQFEQEISAIQQQLHDFEFDEAEELINAFESQLQCLQENNHDGL